MFNKTPLPPPLSQNLRGLRIQNLEKTDETIKANVFRCCFHVVPPPSILCETTRTTNFAMVNAFLHTKKGLHRQEL